MSLDDFERYPLLFGPSPVHPLDRLSAHLGGPRLGSLLNLPHYPGVPGTPVWRLDAVPATFY